MSAISLITANSNQIPPNQPPFRIPHKKGQLNSEVTSLPADAISFIPPSENANSIEKLPNTTSCPSQVDADIKSF
jgi:hypothetical protein